MGGIHRAAGLTTRSRVPTAAVAVAAAVGGSRWRTCWPSLLLAAPVADTDCVADPLADPSAPSRCAQWNPSERTAAKRCRRCSTRLQRCSAPARYRGRIIGPIGPSARPPARLPPYSSRPRRCCESVCSGCCCGCSHALGAHRGVAHALARRAARIAAARATTSATSGGRAGAGDNVHSFARHTSRAAAVAPSLRSLRPFRLLGSQWCGDRSSSSSCTAATTAPLLLHRPLGARRAPAGRRSRASYTAMPPARCIAAPYRRRPSVLQRRTVLQPGRPSARWRPPWRTRPPHHRQRQRLRKGPRQHPQ